jgi:menaquinone-dependent protoporphyrinogen oxidase
MIFFNMTDNILVAYASKHNATKEIAERIGFILSSENLKVTVTSVDKVTDISQYTAIILGSAIYFGQWRMSATRFLKVNKKALLTKKVWIFSSGPLGKSPIHKLTKYWDIHPSLNHQLLSAKPLAIETFHGAINISKLNFLEKEVLDQMKIPLRDYRKWNHIQSWTRSIAAHLKALANQHKIEKSA